MKSLRVAVVGCGQIAHTAHIPNYLACPDVQLVAVMDKDWVRAEECSRTFGVPLAFDSFEAMLDAVDVDAVSICVPNKFHAPYAITALEHGSHVLCEKPPAMTADEAAAMAATAERTGRVLTFGFHYRSAIEVAFIKRFVDNQELGEIYAARAGALRRRGIPSWGVYTNKTVQGGGPLMDIGIHVLDLALWLMDYPTPQMILASTHQHIGTREGIGVFGPWDWRNYSVEDMAHGMIQFTNGASLLLETSFAANLGEQEPIQLSLMGDRGGADVLPPRIYQERHGMLVDTVPDQLTPFDVGTCYMRHIDDFIRCCINGGEPLVSAQQAVTLQRIVDALYLSAEMQQPVEFANISGVDGARVAGPVECSRNTHRTPWKKES